jgi:hypothetical protein
MCWDNYSNVKGVIAILPLIPPLPKPFCKKPIDDTIYFAGEAIPGDNLTGTVEAALVSGKMAAGMITGKHSYAKKLRRKDCLLVTHITLIDASFLK